MRIIQLFTTLFVIGTISCDASGSKSSYNNTTFFIEPKEEHIVDTSAINYKISKAAISIINPNIRYDPTYFSISYPNGDVPADKGVCSDVAIRALRKVGIDLQKEVHEDMQKNFAQYPHQWGEKTTDANIDHRRVPNLMKFFTRKKLNLPISQNPKDYQYGDIVCWNLGSQYHIGIVIHEKNNDQSRPLVIHNIGNGQVKEDVLFAYPIVGHYRITKSAFK